MNSIFFSHFIQGEKKQSDLTQWLGWQWLESYFVQWAIKTGFLLLGGHFNIAGRRAALLDLPRSLTGALAGGTSDSSMSPLPSWALLDVSFFRLLSKRHDTIKGVLSKCRLSLLFLNAFCNLSFRYTNFYDNLGHFQLEWIQTPVSVVKYLEAIKITDCVTLSS